MGVSLNLVVGFNSTLRTNWQRVSNSTQGTPISRDISFTSRRTKIKRQGFLLSVSKSDGVSMETNILDSGKIDMSVSNDEIPAVNSTSESSAGNKQILEASNGAGAPLNFKPDVLPELQPLKRAPLTAREKLKAARVLGRNTEARASKSKVGSSVLDSLRESDRGKKRSGLPEAPINMLDDSKRGMPKSGLTFQFPGGADLFFIVFSFVFISTVMFATTFFVWKVGAIHFNE